MLGALLATEPPGSGLWVFPAESVKTALGRVKAEAEAEDSTLVGAARAG